MAKRAASVPPGREVRYDTRMLPILYLDDHLVAINKPPGLLVHRTGLDAGESRFALQLVRDQLERSVWTVHRLDKGTSGVLLFALDPETASLLGEAFRSGEGLCKTYRAVVRGWPADEGTIDHPLKRLDDDRRNGREECQEAITHFKTLERYTLPLPQGSFPTTRCALMELTPVTGRRHQLRRHMKHVAHPIIGDSTHGKGPLNRDLGTFLGLRRLWLHACQLTLHHPHTGRLLQIDAPLGPEWERWRQADCPAEAST